MPIDGFDVQVITTRLTEKLYELLTALPMLGVALLLVWASWVLGRWLSRRDMLTRLAKRNLAQTTTRLVTLLLGIVVALDLLDATAVVGAVLGTAGVFGLALGFAFKDTLENYLAGVLMSVRQPFVLNDEIVVDGHHGRVVALLSRATILMTLDGNHIRLPNALVFRSAMINYSRNPNRRFGFDVGVGKHEDVTEAMCIGTEALAGLEGVIVKPPPRACVQSLTDSNVQIRYFGWMDQRTHDFYLTRGDAIRAVKCALEAAGMDLPEPLYRLQSSPSIAEGTAFFATADAMTAGSHAPRKHPAPTGTRELVSTKRLNDLDEQIANDRHRSNSENLLVTTALKE